MLIFREFDSSRVRQTSNIAKYSRFNRKATFRKKKFQITVDVVKKSRIRWQIDKIGGLFFFHVAKSFLIGYDDHAPDFLFEFQGSRGEMPGFQSYSNEDRRLSGPVGPARNLSEN